MLILLLIVISILLLLIYLKMVDISPQDFFGEIINAGIVLLLLASPIIIGFIIYIIYQNFGDIIDYIRSLDEKMPAWMDEPIPPWTFFVAIGVIAYLNRNKKMKKTNSKK